MENKGRELAITPYGKTRGVNYDLVVLPWGGNGTAQPAFALSDGLHPFGGDSTGRCKTGGRERRTQSDGTAFRGNGGPEPGTKGPVVLHSLPL